MSTIIINGLAIDAARGFDVMRGKQVVEHFDNYADARKCEAAGRGRYIRYWAAKVEQEGE